MWISFWCHLPHTWRLTNICLSCSRKQHYHHLSTRKTYSNLHLLLNIYFRFTAKLYTFNHVFYCLYFNTIQIFYCWNFLLTEYFVLQFQVICEKVPWLFGTNCTGWIGNEGFGSRIPLKVFHMCCLWIKITQRRSICHQTRSIVLPSRLWKRSRNASRIQSRYLP